MGVTDVTVKVGNPANGRLSVLVVLAAILTSTSLSTTSAAFQTSANGRDVAPAASPHWPRGAVVLTWIDPEEMPPGAAELVALAMRTWTTVAEGRFTLLNASDASRAKLQVHFIRSQLTFGETRPRVDRRTGQIVEVDIGLTVDTLGDALERRIITYLTALHEIGHALGLSHRDDFNSIMYLFRDPTDSERYFSRYRRLIRSPDDIGSPGATGLSVQDIEALRALYDR